MKNSPTTIEICTEKEVDYNESYSKIASQNLKDKTADVAMSFISQMVFSIVVFLFTQLIKIKAFECLSGFCYHNKSEIR